MNDDDFLLSSYTYDIPENQIALYPAESRGISRLLVLNRADNSIRHSTFSDIFSFFPSPVLFVVNNSKVLPARIYLTRATGGKIEALLLSPLPLLNIEQKGVTASCTANILLKGAQRCSLGEVLYTEGSLRVILQEKHEYGKYTVLMQWDSAEQLEDIFLHYGSIPLPPYIKRPSSAIDIDRYQSIFAHDTHCGSVASPTASLHCSQDFIDAMKQHGSSLASVTLYVGYGTFSPIRSADIRDHSMHEEYIAIDEENASRISYAHSQGIPIVPIGTTALRVLESVMLYYGTIKACSMATSLYITPGYTFKCVNSLITNFHLPESSLLVLASAFASRERILSAYKEAIEKGYKFFSYGDAMLIL